MQKILVRSVPNHEASRKFALELCEKHLAPNQPFTLFLEGGLGAGKTFLAKEILAHFGVKDEVSSPTYALVNEYKSDQGTFAHWDFYRLEEEGDFFARGFQDLSGEDGVNHIVEWPERLSPEAKGSFAGTRFVVTIDFGLGVGMRKVKLLKAT